MGVDCGLRLHAAAAAAATVAGRVLPHTQIEWPTKEKQRRSQLHWSLDGASDSGALLSFERRSCSGWREGK